MDTSAGATAKQQLAERVERYTGWPASQLRDADGDLQLEDSPFGLFARLATPRPGLLLVACPLLEVEVTDEVRAILDELTRDRVAWAHGADAIQLFRLVGPKALTDDAHFWREADGLLALGRKVVAAVQPRHGGLTPEQWREARAAGPERR